MLKIDTQAGQMRVVEAGQMCVTACDVCEIHHEDGIKEIAWVYSWHLYKCQCKVIELTSKGMITFSACAAVVVYYPQITIP